MIKNFMSLLIICFVLSIAMPANAGICDIKKPGNYTPAEATKNMKVRDNSYNENNLARLEAAYDKKYWHTDKDGNSYSNAPLGAYKKEVIDPYYDNYRN